MPTTDDLPCNNSELFTDDFLRKGVKKFEEWDCDSEAKDAYDSLKALYEEERDNVEDYKDNEADTEDDWIKPVLEILGYSTFGETGFPGESGSIDMVLFASAEAKSASTSPRDKDDYETVYDNAATILEAKSWRTDFTKKFSEERDYFNAAQQVKYYLKHLPPDTVEWGILTDGKRWRLVGIRNEQHHIFYEMDLVDLLEDDEYDAEAFKYFYCFFSPGAFERSDGECFLDSVYKESANTSEKLGEDLQDNVFEALATRGDGFVSTNELNIDEAGEIDPNSLSIDLEEGESFTLDDLKEQSLVYLYRLMFVFRAEARDLLQPTSDSDKRTYRAELSLLELRDQIIAYGDDPNTVADTYLETSMTHWQRLDTFFDIIDSGREDIGIPAYDGGLFDRDAHPFLNAHPVSNQHLAKVIYLLSTREIDGEYREVTYSDLETRHLGSVYEGMLEHRFKVASEEMVAIKGEDSEIWRPEADTDVDSDEVVDKVAEGNLYVASDDGERKVTGTYYTPEYVVVYLVEQTLDPQINEIRDDLAKQGLELGTPEYAREFRERILDLRVLDPAMGSGHFLTEATAYLAKRVMDVVERADELVAESGDRSDAGSEASAATDGGNPAPRANGMSKFEEQQIRRDIAKECIYGVDKNEMAVELAKLSMWLETIATDQPLAFLDHHLKQGNSLIGADIEEINGLDAGGEKEDQTEISAYTQQRRDVVRDIVDIFEDLIDIPNETLADAREMKRIYYDDIQQDDRYRRLKMIANVHAAEKFGVDWTLESAFERGGLPGDAFNYMAEVLEEDDYWDLDADVDGSVVDTGWFQTAQRRAREESFFHWQLEFPEVFYESDEEKPAKRPDAGFDAVLANPPYIPTELIPDHHKDFLTTKYDDILSGKYDLSVVFLQHAFEICRGGGQVGMITPVSWENGDNYNDFRMENFGEEEVGVHQVINLPYDVFPEAYVDTAVCVFQPGATPSSFQVKEFEKRHQIEDSEEIGRDLIDIDYDELLNDPTNSVYVVKAPYELGKKFGSDEFDTLGDVTDSTQGKSRSHFTHTDKKIDDDYLRYKDCDVYRYELTPTDESFVDVEGSGVDSEYYTTPRVLIRRIVSRDDRLMAMYETDDYVVKKDLNPFLRDGTTVSLQYLLANVNSAFHSYLYINRSSVATKDDFRQTTLTQLRKLPFRDMDVDAPANHSPALSDEMEDRLEAVIAAGETTSENAVLDRVDDAIGSDEQFIHDVVVWLVESLTEEKVVRNALTTDMLRYFGTELKRDNIDDEDNYRELGELETYQPPSDMDTKLLKRTEDIYDSLHIDGVQFERDGITLRLLVDVEATPVGANEARTHEGVPAMEFVNIDDDEVELLRAFVPEAVERADGYANFRNYITKNRSLEYRLRNMLLPETDRVREDVELFMERKEEAARLDDRIQNTDDLIDQIIYRLYQLTDEQMEQIETCLKDD
jgi:type I restriction-modification system DNA methylase subunit